MKARPILFNASMVRAILDGRKTQTRRICKDQPHEAAGAIWWPDGKGTDTGTSLGAPGSYLMRCPFGQPGDQLWVREPFALSVIDPDGGAPQDEPENWDVIYRADPEQTGGFWNDKTGKEINTPWKPSFHMPRWASRITLEITDVRVERLQDISEADAEAEGSTALAHFNAYDLKHLHGFINQWVQINGIKSLESNPWVWVVEFKVIDEQKEAA